MTRRTVEDGTTRNDEGNIDNIKNCDKELTGLPLFPPQGSNEGSRNTNYINNLHFAVKLVRPRK